METTTLPVKVYTVKGTISYTGRPVGQLVVRVSDVDLRKKQLLGTTVTNQSGVYQVDYVAANFNRAEKQHADLQVEVFYAWDKEMKTPVAVSGIVFGANDVEEINIHLEGSKYREPAEFNRLYDAVCPLLDEVHINDLEENEQHKDISFLAGETGWNYEQVEWLALSFKLACDSGIDADPWYALFHAQLVNAPVFILPQTQAAYSLKLKMKAVLAAVQRLEAGVAAAAIKGAVKANIISGWEEDKLAQWLARFKAYAARLKTADSSGDFFVHTLKTAGFNDNQLQELAAAMIEKTPKEGNIGSLLRDISSFSGKEAKHLENIVQLTELSLGNTSFVNAVMRDSKKEGDVVKELAALSTSGIASMIEAKGIEIPDAIPGTSKKEKAERYAVLLNKRIEERYPTAAFLGGLGRSIKNKTTTLAHGEKLRDFLKAHPDFELDKTPVDEFLSKNAGWAGTQQPDASFVRELKATQRLFKIAPRQKAVNTLMESKIHSAQQVYSLGRNQFVKLYKDQPGFNEPLAAETYERAAGTNAVVTTLIGDLRAMEGAYPIQALGGQSEAISSFPHWPSLFGKADICECEHCRSVYSPAAYMTDLLHFLKNRLLPSGTGSAKDILMERRTDLGFLDLNCANANTPLPYVDIACEILEEEIAPAGLFAQSLSAADWSNNTTISASLSAAFSAHSVAFPGSTVVSEIKTVTDRTTYQCRIARNDTATYKIVYSGGKVHVSLTRQTHGTPEELAANAEYVNENAYAKLAVAKAPYLLPLDLFTAEARAYLKKANVEKYDLMEQFQGTALPNNPTGEDIAAEYLEIGKDEKDHIFQPEASSQFQFWSFTSNADMLDKLKKVDVFLNRTGLTYNQLLQLLDLNYINPGGALHIVHEDNSCNTDMKSIQVLDIAAVDRIQRFLRLWRKLKWELWELDYAIGHSKIGQNDIGAVFLKQLRFCKELMGAYKLTIEQVGALLDDISIRSSFTEPFKPRKKSLYEDVFLNRKIMNPPDPAFQLAALPGSDTIKQHAAVLLGGLSIKEQDLDVLLELKKNDGTAYLTDTKLSLPNLSFVYRHALFAKMMGVKIQEWKYLLQLLQADIISFPSARQVSETAQKIKEIREAYSVEELRYLLVHDTGVKAAPSAKTINTFLAALRTEIKKINDEYIVPESRDGRLAAFSAQLQKLGLDEHAVASATSVMDNRNTSFVSLGTPLPAAFVFPEALAQAMNVSYDPAANQLSFTGVMTDTERNTLKTDASLTLVTPLPAWQQAVDTLYNLPRDIIKKELGFYRKPVFTSPLSVLPATVDLKKLPAALFHSITYDTEQLQLVFKGVMTPAERALLDGLSQPGDAAYRAAVLDLLNKSAAAVFPAGELWVLPAHITGMFNTPASIGEMEVLANLQSVLVLLFNHQRIIALDGLIIQQFSGQFGFGSDITRHLLTEYKVLASLDLLTYFKTAAPPFSSDAEAYHWMNKASLIVKREKMTMEGLLWYKAFSTTFGLLDLLALPLVAGAPVASLDKLKELHNTFGFIGRYGSQGDITFYTITEKLNTGAYASNTELSVEVEKIFEWPQRDIKKLTDPGILNIAYPSGWLRLSTWLRMEKVMLLLSRMNADAELALKLANLSIGKAVAAQLKQTISSRYDRETWMQVSKDIQDQLRDRKRQALAVYLLANKPSYIPVSVRWENTNDLFSYYLIDVEMCACQLTSRMVQANGTIQLFAQRCLMGLEPEVKVDKETDDNWLHWKWMKNYRVWEANRKVFLYPENWAEPELRMDKSIFFKEFENELMQNEVNKDTVETAFLNYLDKLDGVAQLEIAGFVYEEDKDTTHVFGRTPVGEPHLYFYRKWVKNRRWTPWTKVEVDIKSDYLIPAIINTRLYIFWPEFSEEPSPVPTLTIPTASSGGTVQEAEKFLKVRMAASEWRNKKWAAKKISKDYLTSGYYRGQVSMDGYVFLPVDQTADGRGFYIRCSGHSRKTTGSSAVQNVASIHGVFEVFGCKGIPELSAASLSVQDAMSVIGTELMYMRPTETMNRQQDTFAIDNKFNYYVPPNILKRGSSNVILDKTPGLFRVTHSPQLMGFDRFFTDSYFTYSNDQYGLVNIWSSFFYADKTKTFFVQPVLESGGEVKYYSDLKAQADLLVRAWEDQVQNYIDAGKITDPQHLKFIWDYAHAIINTWITYLLSLFYPSRQYYFQNFYHPFVCRFAKEVYNRGIEGLMRREIQLSNTGFSFKDTYEPTALVLDPVLSPQTTSKYYPVEVVDFTPDGSYSQYNWELFFHAPLFIAASLSRNQRFEEAMQWYHYIFNPLSPETTGADGLPIPVTNPRQKYWITKPFFERQELGYNQERIDNILKMLAGDTSAPGYSPAYKSQLMGQVEDWRDNPFDPHIIAQFRTVAYQKKVIMKYTDNLIAWGDQLFGQDTIESINEATQLYVLAADILGPRPKKVSPAHKPVVESYHELEGKIDDFSNALVAVENLVPVVSGSGGSGPVPQPLILYFCIPPNDRLMSYWDTVEDRLYKIRHCMNIEGVFRQLALFQPAIDPGAIISAMAGGADLSSALADMSAPLPLYRFTPSLQKASELCNDLKALSSALLSALEKKDAESMALLRQTHEQKVLEAVRDVKVKQIEDAQTMLEGLRKNQQMVKLRRDFYASRKFMNEGEIAAMALSGTSIGLQAVAMVMDILGGVLTAIPNFTLGASGFGGTPQATAQTGGMAFGRALELGAKGISQSVGILDKSASLVTTLAGYQRRKEDWDLQKDLASKELEQMEKSIASARMKVEIAEKELKNHDLQMENSRSVDEFMKTKYTNRELYEWMIGQLSQTYFQSYQLAVDLARRAEKCYQFELGIENSSFIKHGYWDSLKKGLLSGEKLQYDLRRMEASYMEQNRRELEITKHISLALLNPQALLQLKEVGSCVVSLPESLFDLDFPGHYFRRIKSVALTLPCIAGPHTGVNCTLRLLKNSIRINSKLNSNQYERNHDEAMPLDDDRFRESSMVVKSIATSHGQNDTGVFELGFKDERYIPFEGAGAISTWSIELMTHSEEDTRMLRQFNYDTISDVIIHLKYTAREDAGIFKKEAIKHLKALVQDAAQNYDLPLNMVMSVKHEFPQEYHQLVTSPVSPPTASTVLKITGDRFPYLTQGFNLWIKKVMLVARFSDDADTQVKLEDPAGNLADFNLTSSGKYGSRIKHAAREFDIKVEKDDVSDASWDWILSLDRARAEELRDLAMIVEYELK
jgi:hypothetical protein